MPDLSGQLKSLIDQSPASPYPRFRKLREADPVSWHPRAQAWLLTRHADASLALKDRRLGNTYLHKLFESLNEEQRRRAGPMCESLGLWLLYRDAPDHTRIRSLVARAFTPKMVVGLRPALEQTVAGLLDAVDPRGEMDIIGELAYPLPIITIATLLGAAPEDREQFKRWADDLARLLGHHRAEAAQVEAACPAWSEMTEFFRSLMRERRRSPREDLMSALVAAEEQGSRLSEDEILATCAALLFAGSETTTHLIGNAVLALLAHPAQRVQLEQHPERMASAIEEFLRYDSPTQAAARIALDDLELGGRRIKKGQAVIALLGAANRDPAQFANPDELDLSRAQNAHLSFSLGPHYCLGAPLARAEAEIALGALLRRFPLLRCESAELTWLDNPTIRGLTRLPVKLSPKHFWPPPTGVR